jgi:DNA ligase 1
MSRLLEATDQVIQTQQVIRITRDLEAFDSKAILLSIIDKDNLEANQLGLAKAKKWLAKIFDVFDDEIEGQYNAHNDLGEAIYYLDSSAETQRNLSLNQVHTLLEINCGKIDSNQFSLIEEAILNMSSNERKWFIRYWLRTPRNGMNSGTVTKILARYYKKKESEVKKHLNYNSVNIVTTYYEMGETPPTNLSHGGFVSPMLAKEIPMNKWPTNKIVDYKYDGNRYQIHLEDKNVIIFNRKGKIVTHQFPEVVGWVAEYDVKNGIFDGEIYPITENNTPAPHKLMGTRVHSKDIQEAMAKVPIIWVIFDCLKLNGETIMDFSFTERLEKMKNLPNQAHRMEGGDVLAFYNRAINDGFEGIIVKNADVGYEAGKRSAFWAKYKPPRIELDVVVLTAKYGQGKRSNVFGTYEVGVKANNGYHSLGSVGTGFSDEDLVSLTNTLRRNVEKYDNNIFYVSPTVVLEITADLVSRDDKGNLGLRFPRCVRIRDDKFVADINTLEDVERLE